MPIILFFIIIILFNKTQRTMCLKLSTCFECSRKQDWLSAGLWRGRADKTDCSVTTDLTQKWTENFRKGFKLKPATIQSLSTPKTPGSVTSKLDFYDINFLQNVNCALIPFSLALLKTNHSI